MIRLAFQIYLVKYEVRSERDRNGCKKNWSLGIAFFLPVP